MGWREGVARAVAGSDARVISGDMATLMEAAIEDAAYLRRERDLYGWTALTGADSSGSRDQRFDDRLRIAREARRAWEGDVLAGRAIDLLNQFVLGRGVPMPRAKDKGVQKVLEEVWNDPDNKASLTGLQAQLAMNTDLTIQANLFVAFFADGDDGKVKVGIVPHDTVQSAVRHPAHDQRVLYYVAKRVEREWDFATDSEKIVGGGLAKTVYYEAWGLREAVEEARKAGASKLPVPPKEKVARGRVYHIALNRGTEQVFGRPEFGRVVPWMSSYNAFMASRVDMMKAAAALIVKMKLKGTANQVQKAATQAISRRGSLGASRPATDALIPPANASSVVENESMTVEPFNLDSGAGNAAQDAAMLRSNVAAGTGWPQHYLGDATNANLATATSLELPILKAVELRQELLEQLYRAFFDLAIERAVEVGVLSKEADESAAAIGEALDPEEEAKAQRDLSYEFSLPNPLKRAMGELVTAATSVARSFDPNNTNLELSRVLLQIVLADGFEVEDPAGMVGRVFPDGYVDPAVAAAQAMQQQQMSAAGGDVQVRPQDQGGGDQGGGGGDTFTGADGEQHSQDNPYGAPMRSQAPENVGMQQAEHRELPGSVETRLDGEKRLVLSGWDREVAGAIEDALRDVDPASA